MFAYQTWCWPMQISGFDFYYHPKLWDDFNDFNQSPISCWCFLFQSFGTLLVFIKNQAYITNFPDVSTRNPCCFRPADSYLLRANQDGGAVKPGNLEVWRDWGLPKPWDAVVKETLQKTWVLWLVFRANLKTLEGLSVSLMLHGCNPHLPTQC